MIALNSQLTQRFRRLDYRRRPSAMPHSSYSQQMAPPQYRQRTRPCASKHLHPWEYRDRPQRQSIVGTDSRDLRVKRKITISKMWKLCSREDATHVESTLEVYHGHAPTPVLDDSVDVLSEELRTTASSETSTQMYSCKSKCSSIEAPPSYQDALNDDYYSVDTTARAPCPSTPPPSYSSLVNCS